MSIAKVIEVIAEGNTVEDAISSAIKQSSKTVDEIQQIYVEGIEAFIKDGKVSFFRINARISYGKN